MIRNKAEDNAKFSWFRFYLSGILVKNRAIVLLALIVAFMSVSVSRSHEIRPAVIEIDIGQPKFVKLKALANFEALIAGISSKLGRILEHSDEDLNYEKFRSLSQTEFEQKVRFFLPAWIAGLDLKLNGKKIALSIEKITVRKSQDKTLPRLTEVYIIGAKPENVRRLNWSLKSEFGTNIIRIKTNDTDPIKAYWLKNGEKKSIIINKKTEDSYFQAFSSFLNIGIFHILPYGLDHVLFILGLYFLSTRIKLLLIQVTTFTIAHSITLALATFRAEFQIAPLVIEPLIAASIIFVAIENFFTDRLSKWRSIMIFAFGLVHGVGFSGVLRETDFSEIDALVALAGFSIGVELGQILVICIAYLLVGCWFRRKWWYRRRIAQPCSLLIGIFGIYWLFQRLLPIL